MVFSLQRLRQPAETNAYLRQLMRAALLLGGVQGFRLVLLLIRNKALAIWLGPAGLGALSQINGVADTASLLCGAGLAAAVTRFMAADPAMHSAGREVAESEAGSDEPRYSASEVATLGAQMMLGGALLLSLVLILFRTPISQLATGNSSYGPLLAIIAFAVPLSVVYLWSTSLLQAAGNVRGQGTQSVWFVVLWLILAVALVSPFGIAGGIWAILLTWAGSAVISLAVLRRHKLGGFIKLQWRPFDARAKSLAKLLLRFGGVALMSALSPLLVVVGTRAVIMHWGGESSAGYYQVPVSMSNLSFNPLVLAISGFVLPHLYKSCRGALTDWDRLHRDLETTLLLILGVMTPVITLLLLLRHTLTHLLFSAKFAPGAAMIAPQLAADFVHALVWWMALPLLPLGRYKASFVCDAVTVVATVGGAWFFLPRYGLAGAPIGSLLAQLIVVGGLIIYRRRSDGLHLRAPILAALLASCTFISIMMMYALRG